MALARGPFFWRKKMKTKELNIKESVTASNAQEFTKDVREERKDLGRQKLKKFMNEELRMVKGIFKNFETPGMAVPIQVRKYPGNFFNQVLEDGKTYEVPLYVARHLNGIDVTAEAIGGQLGTCSFPVHSHIMDQNGMPIVSTTKRKQRFGFQSLDFGA
jgi:hypothetical protein